MRRWMFSMACAAAVSALVAGTASAQPDEVDEPIYLTVDVGVTGALNDPVENLFEVGGDAGLGLYFSLLPELALGAHVLGGALAEGAAVDGVDRGLGDYGLLAASVRFHPFASVMGSMRRASGLYLAASPGVGLFDGEIVPGYSMSLGYNFDVGPISIGPKARFTHFIETHERFGDNDVLMMTGGLEVAFLDEARVVPPEPAPEPPPVAVVEPEPEPEPQPEPEPEPTINDALTLDERVYFDYDQAELREAAARELDAIVAHYREWEIRYERLVISGHADDRGSAEYNEVLSAARALAVANYLVSQGVPVELLELDAYGEAEPLVARADTEPEHQLNRRVQFDVEWREGRRPVGVAPEPAPNQPAYVDAAPAEVRRNPEAWADAEPRPGLSHAQALLDRERQELRRILDAPVRIELREAPEALAARSVEIEVGEGAVAGR